MKKYRKVAHLPGAGRFLGLAIGFNAPYFLSVLPNVVRAEPNHVEVKVKKWWGVQNHIKTVHAIAVCNGLELAMGVLAEATIPSNKRWLPKGMDVEYVSKSTGDVTCVAKTTQDQWDGDNPDVPVEVTAMLSDGTVVARGTIHLWVTTKPQRS